jgi:4-methyl-5(b-hydroxyethyl)-thiazole monophosphate biosynthesis
LKEKYTAYPGWESNIRPEGYVADAKVVEDQNVLTSKGPGTAICFGLEIVRKFAGEEVYQQLKSGLLADYC